MDFSYFTSAPQPYQFFGLPPTPAGSSTPQADDFKNTTSPDQYDAAFAAFQQSFHYNPTTFLAQPHNISPESPPRPLRNDSIISIPDLSSTGILPPVTDLTPDEQRARSSSEEKESLTPAQSRRKAQNRAAQRAFRERKERHVKDLEAKLTSLEQQSAVLSGENERLRRELARVATENEILRATSSPHPHGSHPFLTDADEISSTGPLKYSPTDSRMKNSSLGDSHDDSREKLDPASLNGLAKQASGHRFIVADDTGEALLAAGATWDYIQAHELFRKGLVDVGDVCERLKKLARCDGQGPVFEEGDVRRAIAESAVAGGRDELI